MVYVWEPVSEGLADFPEKQRMTLGFGPPDEFYRKKRLGLAITEDDLPTDRLDGPFTIPEIFNIVMDFTIVSAEVRRALETYAPGDVKFHRLPFAISDRMQARSQYFYPEVIAREQRLDWQKTPLEPISETQPDGTAKTLMPGYIYGVLDGLSGCVQGC